MFQFHTVLGSSGGHASGQGKGSEEKTDCSKTSARSDVGPRATDDGALSCSLPSQMRCPAMRVGTEPVDSAKEEVIRHNRCTWEFPKIRGT